MADDLFSQSMEWFQSYWRQNPQGDMPLEELDRKIAELRAVEAWLSMNQGLLRSSIQMLEMQRDMLSRFRHAQQAAPQEQFQQMNQAFLEGMQRFSTFWMPKPPASGGEQS